MKKIPLSQGKYAMVDDEDFTLISQYRWHVHKRGGIFYARRWIGRTRILMHNLILGFKGADHKNRNGLDNQRENLRPASQSQNLMNSSPNKGRKFKGAHRNGKGWEARIKINGRRFYLGQFKTEEEAARTYDVKARELFGEFARLNFS